MVNEMSWINDAYTAIESIKIEHPHYIRTRNRIISGLNAIRPGEIIVVVGPSRAGKSRCILDALRISPRNIPDENLSMHSIYVEAENSSVNGELSTKALTVACLKAVNHPIFGAPDINDPWGIKYSHLITKTPETTLKEALEIALIKRQVEYLVIDEAHHIQYARGGDPAAARILDSFKCMASKTKLKIVLSGSYKLYDILCLAPHLIGRQQSMEFPRYRDNSRSDVFAWEQILREFSNHIRFHDGESLSIWNQLLFEGSHGCVGLLSQWLRSTLAAMQSEGANRFSYELLLANRLSPTQDVALLNEILAGERHSFHQTLTYTANNDNPDSHLPEKAKRRGKAFKPKSTRRPAGGRV